jgi:hypothetical protein
MKTIALIVAALLSMAVQGASAASKPRVMLHGDVTVPVQPETFGQGFSVGLGGGVGVALPVSSRFVLIADLDFVTFGVDDDDFKEAFAFSQSDSLAGSQIAALYASVSVKFFTPTVGPVKPYAFGGIGFFRYNPDEFSVNGAPMAFAEANVAGAHVGGGLEVDIATYLGVFGDIFYVHGFTDEATAYVPIRLGLVFDWNAQE